MRIISDGTVKAVLAALQDTHSLERIQQVLSDALKQYSRDRSILPERTVVSRPDAGAVHLFMPAFCSGKVGVKTLAGSAQGFKGSVLVIDENNGDVQGVVNAMTLTAFRTGLASTLALGKFFDRKTPLTELSVFGNGLQAYWHARLTLLLYPRNFTRLQIVVRNINDKSKQLHAQLMNEFKKIDVDLVKQSDGLDLSQSAVVFGCVPSTEPAIKLDSVNKTHPVYISIIGSYKPHMFEVDDALVQSVLSQGKVIVDSSEHALHEAGELIRNKVTPENCVELGDLDNYNSISDINKGNITLVKIVGLAIMDIVMANDIMQFAEANNLGNNVDFA